MVSEAVVLAWVLELESDLASGKKVQSTSLHTRPVQIPIDNTSTITRRRSDGSLRDATRTSFRLVGCETGAWVHQVCTLRSDQPVA